MLNALNAADQAFTWLLRMIIYVTSAVVTLALVALVLARFFFHQSLHSVHELSLLAAMWLYMAGAVMASRRSEHLVVDFLATSLGSKRAKTIHAFIVATLTLIISAIFAYWIWKMLAWGAKRPQTIPVLDAPLWVAQAPLAMAALAAIIYALRDMARAAILLADMKAER